MNKTLKKILIAMSIIIMLLIIFRLAIENLAFY